MSTLPSFSAACPPWTVCLLDDWASQASVEVYTLLACAALLAIWLAWWRRHGMRGAAPPLWGNLLNTWAIHDLNHLGQIVEVMSHQYDAAVGPWKTYLTILNRPVLTE